MTLNSYQRALIINLVICSAFVFSTTRPFDGAPGRLLMVVLALGGCVASAVTFLVGTLSRISGKPWPWSVLVISSALSWFAIMFVLLLVIPHAGDIVEVQPPNGATSQPPSTAP